MKNYSKRLIDVIEYSREEAARLQNSYIGPEHLMLGIIREGEGEPGMYFGVILYYHIYLSADVAGRLLDR